MGRKCHTKPQSAMKAKAETIIDSFWRGWEDSPVGTHMPVGTDVYVGVY